MINKQEIIKKAKHLSLLPNIVEKDYVLGWIIWGLNKLDFFHNWAFKGGTCIKKCYITDYRLSEDLDYSLIKYADLVPDELVNYFKKVAEIIYEASGIEIPTTSIEFEKFKNNRGLFAIQGKFSYIGPLRPRNSLPKIKIDLSLQENLITPPQIKQVFHDYSDNIGGFIASCYALEEIMAEKIRA